MAEGKQYIMQTQDNGCVMISEDVIATIVAHAINEIDGVAGLNVKPGADIAELIGKKNWGKGVKVIISDDNELSIDCNITVIYGFGVVDIAKKVQQSVSAAVESMTGILAQAVNINVCGIVRQ